MDVIEEPIWQRIEDRAEASQEVRAHRRALAERRWCARVSAHMRDCWTGLAPHTGAQCESLIAAELDKLGWPANMGG